MRRSTTPDLSAFGPPPPFDRECAEVLSAMEHPVPIGLTPDLIPAMRGADNHPSVRPHDEELRRSGTFDVCERSVPGPPGAPAVSLLICRPVALIGPAPAVYFTHGGGMVSGNNRQGVLEILDWAQMLGLVVISVEYRLAPETPHPGPIEDCYAGLVWTVDHAHEIGVDDARVVLAGHSAGGGLAAALALLARDRGGPRISGQILMCPMLDDRNDTASARQMAGLGIWDRRSNETGWTSLLGDARGGPDVSWYAAPARASDLAGLPPTFVDVGSAETFRDEAVSYANGLWYAGVDAELHVWPGGFHHFDSAAPHARLSRATRSARVDWLRRLLARWVP